MWKYSEPSSGSICFSIILGAFYLVRLASLQIVSDFLLGLQLIYRDQLPWREMWHCRVQHHIPAELCPLWRLLHSQIPIPNVHEIPKPELATLLAVFKWHGIERPQLSYLGCQLTYHSWVKFSSQWKWGCQTPDGAPQNCNWSEHSDPFPWRTWQIPCYVLFLSQ